MTVLSKDDAVGTITIEAPVTRQMMDDFLVTAFEGGINYWCKEIHVVGGDYKGGTYASDVISRDGDIWVVCFEPPLDDEAVSYRLTKPQMLSGIQKACEHFEKTLEALYDYHDAIVADVIVQYALWNEVIYG